MPKKRDIIKLTEDKKTTLKKIANSRTGKFYQIQRAKILLALETAESYSSIAKMLSISITAVVNCHKRFLLLPHNIIKCLDDRQRSGRRPLFDFEKQIIVTNLSCKKPRDLKSDHSKEIWTQKQLAEFVRETYPDDKGLNRLSQSQISKLFKKRGIKPFKFNYYLNHRDVDFDSKMKMILEVYRDVQELRELEEKDDLSHKEIWRLKCSPVTIFADEKTAIRALKSVHPDIMPSFEKQLDNNYQKAIKRDPSYVKMGTVDLFGGLNANTGEIYSLVTKNHKSCDFIQFLKLLDQSIEKTKTIRVVLDNLKVHSSKETIKWVNSFGSGRKFLTFTRRQNGSLMVGNTINKRIKVTRLNDNKIKITALKKRFDFTFLPKHGSWLNAVEGVFSRMARGTLKDIRVNSRDELETRIYQGVEELNKECKPPNWEKFLQKYFNKSISSSC